MCAYKASACSGCKGWDRVKYALDDFNVWRSGCEISLKKQLSLWNKLRHEVPTQRSASMGLLRRISALVLLTIGFADAEW
jgi:hypothetical protein